MRGMGLIFTHVSVRCLLGLPGLSGLMTSTSWIHGTSKQSCWKPTHPLLCAIRDITVVVKIVAQNPAVLATELLLMVMKH